MRSARLGALLGGLVLLHAAWLAFRWGGGRATDIASDVLQTTVLAGAAAWTWASARRAGDQATAWRLLAVGLAAWTLATAYWTYWEVARETVLPVPSLSDAGWLAYPLLATSAFLVAGLRGRSAEEVGVALLDSILTAVGVFLVAWVLLVEEVWAAASGSLAQRALALAYPLGDIAVVSAAVGWAFRTRRTTGLWTLPVGAAVVAVGNFNLSWSYLHAGFQTGSVSDVCWTAGVGLMAYGVAQCVAASAGAPRGVSSTAYEQAVPYATAALALGFLVWHYVATSDLGDVEEAVALAWILGFLLRQFLFLRHAVEVQESLEDAQLLAGLGAWEWRGGAIRLSPIADHLLTGAPQDGAGRHVAGHVAWGDVQEDDRLALQAGLGDLAASGVPLDRRLRVRRADGGIRHLQVRGAAGSPPRGTVQDITREVEEAERRRREEAATAEVHRLNETNRVKTEFINMAAHELGTPLQPIRLALSTLERPARDLEAAERQRADLVPLLRRNVDRLTELLKDILEAARVQASRLDLKLRKVDLAATATEILEEFRPAYVEAKVDLQVEAQAVPVNADPSRLRQVVVNLLSNALKFTPAGGTVKVQVTRDGALAKLNVTDTGSGMRAEDVARLFQPFTQVGDQPVQTRQGTGLGLYLSRGIVEQHGGRMTATSPGLGKGSSFVVELPVDTTTGATAAQALSPIPHKAS